jgi:nitric oxide dioxygenase
LVSNTLHSKSEGDVISISSPAGLFHLEKDSQNPLVLISGGVGLTPMLSMLETNLSSLQNKKTIWIHGCRNESVHAFKNQIIDIQKEAKHLETFTFYDTVEDHDETSNQVIKGRVDLHKCKEAILLEEAKFYICGPEMFIKTQYEALINLNVNKENIFYEEFGPQLINLN